MYDMVETEEDMQTRGLWLCLWLVHHLSVDGFKLMP